MLLSMTGYGACRLESAAGAASVEVRCVNSRHFKLSFRCPDAPLSWEPRVEQVVRETVRRGTIQIHARLERPPTAEKYRVHREVLHGYREQLGELARTWQQAPPSLESLLTLPGVIEEAADAVVDEASWAVTVEAIRGALGQLERMRAEEGAAMARDLRDNAAVLAARLDAVAIRAPVVVEQYRARLLERVGKWLAEAEVSVSEPDLLREVAVFAERCDISEEIVRLHSHLQQFEESVGGPESTGRKLDFLAQEMNRETNTIGAKANDAEIAQHVVDMKTALDRLREMIQNVE